MDKIKKLLLVHMPGSACNLRCEYCYITNQHLWDKESKALARKPEEILKALDPKRVGGVCFINFCTSGETLIFDDSMTLIRGFLELGHYVEVVTNGTLSKRFDEIAEFPEKLRKHLTFKFSFHYAELKRLNLIDVYFDNVWKMHNAGCSFTVELTPYDKIEKDKDEIMSVCYEKLGNPCQLTIARDDTKPGIPVMSKRTLDDYANFWSDFGSTMLDFKKTIFGVKRTEFCYAGMLSMNVDLSTGNYYKCYSCPVAGNIFDNMDEPIKFEAIGYCPVAHCYNGHAHMTLGLAPKLKTPTYAHIRNIKLCDGTDSLNDDFKNIFNQKITDNNELLSAEDERKLYVKAEKAYKKAKRIELVKGKLRKVKHTVKKILKK